MASVPYFSIVPCCSSSGTATSFFNFPSGEELPATGTYVYYGSTVIVNGITFTPGHCYTITGIGISLTDYSDAPVISNFVAVADCSDKTCFDCQTIPPPVPKCFMLWSCDGEVIVTNSNLLAYSNTFISILEKPGCWFVTNSGPIPCEGPNVQKVTPDLTIPCGCTSKCYQVTGDPATIFYVDSDGNPQHVTGTSKFCSLIPPVVTGGLTGSIYDFGPCSEGLCQDLCFEFTNCQTSETLVVSNTPQITEYFVDGKIVTLNGYDGCWSISLGENCDCAVIVTILQSYDSCETCLPVTAYQFTNCNNQSIVKYSKDDYSQYVGKTVVLECGECWFVSLINFNPPSVQPIDILNVFESCIACSKKYYTLTDCSGIENPIYTYSDLSNQIDKVVKIKDCDTCWLVTELLVPTYEQSTAAISLSTTSLYTSCDECLLSAPCQCSIAWPNEEGILSYIDCQGSEITLTGLSPNEQSERLCITKWIIARNPIYYGDCVNGKCPPVVQPKRFIKPGYFTPGCDPEKFEKYTCKSSEILYKIVLQKRYGISNCCPDTDVDEKWLIKKELTDLQGLFDENYICKPSSSCCSNNLTGNCGCNSCNS